MSEAANDGAARPEVGSAGGPTPGAATPEHGASPCPVAWCPICITVGAVQPLRPDVVEHLLRAGTEMLLAFRAVIDDRADDVSGAKDTDGPTRLEKIDLG